MEKALLHLISEVNKEHQQVKEKCDRLKELLKPWPPKKQETALANCGSSSKEVFTEGSTKKEENLSTEEQQAMLQVEKLLQKAHITRQVKDKHKKLAEKDESSASGDTNTNENMLNYTDEEGACSSNQCTPDEHNENNHRNTDDDCYSLVHPGNATPDLERNSTSKGLRKGKSMRSVTAQASHKTDKSVSSKNRCMSKPFQPTGTLSNPMHRPQRPASGKKQYVPVHMSAPFKTEENLKLPARKTMQAHSLPKSSRSKPRPGSGLSSHSYKTLPAIKSGRDDQGNSHRNTLKVVDKAVDNKFSRLPSPQEIGSAGSSDQEVDNKLKNHQSMKEQIRPEDELSCPTPFQPSHHPGNSQSEPHTAEMTPKQEPFTLKKHGFGLKIPAKLTKLVSVNNSLREQCAATKLLKRVSRDDSGQNFVERLQGQWEISEELWTRVRALTCLRAHKILLDMLCELNLSDLRDQSSYQELYRAKRTLEFVLSMFASLQEESDYLSKVQFKTVDSISVHHQTGHENVLSDDEAGGQDKTVAERLRGCEKWTRLKFTESYLCIQLKLLELVHAYWWLPCSQEAHDPSVLQALYSLMSSGGQFLPAFVYNER